MVWSIEGLVLVGELEYEWGHVSFSAASLTQPMCSLFACAPLLVWSLDY